MAHAFKLYAKEVRLNPENPGIICRSAGRRSREHHRWARIDNFIISALPLQETQIACQETTPAYVENSTDTITTPIRDNSRKEMQEECSIHDNTQQT